MDVEGIYLNIIKATYDKPTINIVLKHVKESNFSKIRKKTRGPTLTTIIQHGFGSPSSGNQGKKTEKKRGVQFEKEVTFSLLADGMI